MSTFSPNTPQTHIDGEISVDVTAKISRIRLRGYVAAKRYKRYAKVAELVDALASGVSVLTDVRVQVPLFAPTDCFFLILPYPCISQSFNDFPLLFVHMYFSLLPAVRHQSNCNLKKLSQALPPELNRTAAKYNRASVD